VHTEGLLDAGLAPIDLVSEDGTDTVRARRYTHPQLGARAVVRLTGDLPAPGEDRALAFLGFAAPAAGEPLAQARRRGLGYPAWDVRTLGSGRRAQGDRSPAPLPSPPPPARPVHPLLAARPVRRPAHVNAHGVTRRPGDPEATARRAWFR
jgi:hypothetical protein